MAPRRAVDKGKAPMTETDEVNRPVTRSRSTGIVIREASESLEPERRSRRRPRTVEVELDSQGIAQQAETAQPEPKSRAQDVPMDKEPLREKIHAPESSSGMTSANLLESMPKLEEKMTVMIDTMTGMMQSFRDYVQAQEKEKIMASKRFPSPENFWIGLGWWGEKKIKREKGDGQSRRQRLRSRQATVPPGQKVCFKCGQVGHMKANCPQPPGQKGCFKCGQVGHMQANCPQHQRPTQGQTSKQPQG